MNPNSLRKTSPGQRIVKNTILLGYQRIINAPVNGYLYLNLRENTGFETKGILISLNQKDFRKIKKREIGYKCVDITKKLAAKINGKAFAFIAPNKKYPKMKIPRSYLITCLSVLPKKEQKIWLKETIIENEIEEDVNNPVYTNTALR